MARIELQLERVRPLPASNSTRFVKWRPHPFAVPVRVGQKPASNDPDRSLEPSTPEEETSGASVGRRRRFHTVTRVKKAAERFVSLQPEVLDKDEAKNRSPAAKPEDRINESLLQFNRLPGPRASSAPRPR
jgi:hypothetical protein